MTIKQIFVVMTLIFIVSTVFGYAFPYLLGGDDENIIKDIGRVAQLFKPFEVSTALMILFKNLLVVALMYITSFFVVGPSAIVSFNGFIVGVVTHFLAQISPLLPLAVLAPHGAIEIPAILLAASSSTSLGINIWRAILGRPGGDRDLAEAAKKVPKMLMCVVVMLVIACIIETFVTPIIISSVLKMLNQERFTP